MSGKLKFNIGKIDFNEKGEEISIDIRIPVKTEKQDVVDALTRVANQFGLTYTEFDFLRSIYVPLDSKLIKSLMASYVEVTGDTKSQPEASGGATYARAMDHCVAFGSMLPNSEKQSINLMRE